MLCKSLCHQINNECWFTRSKRTRKNSSRVSGSHTLGKQLEASSRFAAPQLFFSFFSAACVSLNFSPGSSSMSVLLLRNYRRRLAHKVFFQPELQKAMSGPCDICGAVWSGERAATDRTLVLRVCVNLIMLTDYRFKYFKSHRAHAAGDEESGNDCSNAWD